MAGGSVYDIALVHGISVAEVYNSVWEVVKAINNCESLAFKFPSCHLKQQELANEFSKLSAAASDNCVETVDGIFIWTVKPKKEDCVKVKCGGKNFTAARKTNLG